MGAENKDNDSTYLADVLNLGACGEELANLPECWSVKVERSA
jgi:hypothetical protein